MTGLLFILALILANALFAGAEIAVLTIRRTRLAELVDEKRAGAASLAALRADAEGFLATVQIGITLVGAAAAAVGGASLAAPIASFLVGMALPEELAVDVALALVVLLVSFLSLVLGELVPKSLALRYAETFALIVARPLGWLARGARPAVRFLTGCSNLVLRLFGDRTSFGESRLSREELQTLVEETAIAGGLDPRAGEIASRALDLHGLKVGSIMTPRPLVRSLDLRSGADDLRKVLSSCSFERFPVHDGSLDGVRGYVLARDLLLRLVAGDEGALEGIVREAPYFPPSADALAVMKELQEKHIGIAFVVDEQGGFEGLVTFEDLVEEVVGEIFHEREVIAAMIRAEPDGSWILDGRTPIRDANRLLEAELPEESSFSTVAGLLLQRLGRIPSVGERVEEREAGLSLEVVENSPRRIRKVRIRRLV